MEFGNPVVGSEELIRSAIKSRDYAPGTAGWRIAADGEAEFTGLVVNSAGVQGTITLENGEILVRRNSDNEVIAKVYSTGDGGFYVRDPDDASVLFAELSARYLRFNKEVSPASSDGEFSWNENAGINCNILMSSGKLNAGHQVGQIFLTSSSGIDPIPFMTIVGENGEECSLNVGGDINIMNTAPFSGTPHSLKFNGIDAGRGMADWVAVATSTGTVTTTETVGYSSNSTVFKTGRAYKIHVHLLLSSTVANDVVSTRTRRTNAAGAILMDSQSTAQIPGNSFTSVIDYQQVVVNSTGSDITDTLAVTYYRVQGTGNVRIVANSTNVAFIEIRDVGTDAMYPGAIALV